MPSPDAIRLKLLRSAPLNSWIALSEDESRIVATGANLHGSRRVKRTRRRPRSADHKNAGAVDFTVGLSAT